MAAQILAICIFVGMFLLIILDKFERYYITLASGALVLALVFGVCMHSMSAICVALMYGRGTFPCYADRGCAFSFSSHRAMQRIVGIAIEAEIPIKAVL